jgi:hypothetical protein
MMFWLTSLLSWASPRGRFITPLNQIGSCSPVSSLEFEGSLGGTSMFDGQNVPKPSKPTVSAWVFFRNHHNPMNRNHHWSVTFFVTVGCWNRKLRRSARSSSTSSCGGCGWQKSTRAWHGGFHLSWGLALNKWMVYVGKSPKKIGWFGATPMT